jgi:hypothetical protein
MISRCNISKELRDILDKELEKIGEDFTNQLQRLQIDLDNAKKDHSEIETQLKKAQQQLLAVTKHQDQIKEDRVKFHKRIEELTQEYKKTKEKTEKMWKEWQTINDDLVEKVNKQQEQLSKQDDQLKGKRALLLNANPSETARRHVTKQSVRNPFESSSMAQGSFFTGKMGSFSSPMENRTSKKYHSTGGSSFVVKSGLNDELPSTVRQPIPENGEPRRPFIETDQSLREFYTTNGTYPTEPGDSPHRHAFQSPASVLHHKHEDNVAPRYRNAITKLYSHVENWSRAYADQPNPQQDRTIARSNDVLWAYMMNCAYPGHRQDSYTHVVAILNDPDTRYWFVMRMMIEYCVKDVMVMEAFMPYSNAAGQKISKVLLKMAERGIILN